MDIAFPSFGDFCIQSQVGPGEICIFFPGGATICASVGVDIGDPSTIVDGVLAQINTALAPLTPFLNVLDVIKCLVDCIQAIPASLGPPPDPSQIVKCIENLLKALAKLAELFPPLSIFKLVKSILNAIILGLLGIRQKLQTILDHLQRILAAGTAATALGNVDLQAVADCAQSNLDIQMQNMNASMAPLNRLIGLVNALLKLAGLPCIPTLGDVSADALAPLDAAIDALQAAADAIPTSIDLGLIPGPDEPC